MGAEYLEHLRELARKAQNKYSRDYFNSQARDYIFHANNASCEEGEIDLHGLPVKDAVDFLQKRIEAELKTGRHGICV